MQSLVYFTAVWVASVILFCSVSVHGSEDGVRFACNNGTFGPTAQLRGKLKACHNTEIYGHDEGKKDPKCAAFCFTEAINGLKDGIPDKTAFEQLINAEFPETEKKSAMGLLELCFQQHGTVDLKDEKCVDIAAFSACATSMVKKTTCPHPE